MIKLAHNLQNMVKIAGAVQWSPAPVDSKQVEPWRFHGLVPPGPLETDNVQRARQARNEAQWLTGGSQVAPDGSRFLDPYSEYDLSEDEKQRAWVGPINKVTHPATVRAVQVHAAQNRAASQARLTPQQQALEAATKAR